MKADLAEKLKEPSIRTQNHKHARNLRFRGGAGRGSAQTPFGSLTSSVSHLRQIIPHPFQDATIPGGAGSRFFVCHDRTFVREPGG